MPRKARSISTDPSSISPTNFSSKTNGSGKKTHGSGRKCGEGPRAGEKRPYPYELGAGFSALRMLEFLRDECQVTFSFTVNGRRRTIVNPSDLRGAIKEAMLAHESSDQNSAKSS